VASQLSPRVLHVTPYFAPAFGYGGPPRSVLGLCRGLRDAGAEVSVVTTTANGDDELPADAASRPTYDGVPVTYLARTFPRRYFAAASLPAVLAARSGAVDVVHIHGCWNLFGWAAAAWCRRAGVPYVVSPRGMLYPWSFEHTRLKKTVAYRVKESTTLRCARFVHTTSDEESRVVAGLRIAREIVMVPNGVELPAPTPASAAAAFRQRAGASPSDFVVLFLGRLHPKKGVDRLVEAFRAARRVCPDAFLLLAGSGDDDYVCGLRESTRDLVADRRIAFTGFLDGDDRRLAFASANAFALTSHSENFGLGVAEAMAAGLPVIVTRECPWPQIEAWRAGCWVENRPDAIAGAIVRLAADRADAAVMGENGRAGVAQTLAWPALASRMLCAYRGALVSQ
jgi:glycosyltransferase involved in cell wall biosynthesis